MPSIPFSLTGSAPSSHRPAPARPHGFADRLGRFLAAIAAKAETSRYLEDVGGF